MAAIQQHKPNLKLIETVGQQNQSPQRPQGNQPQPRMPQQQGNPIRVIKQVQSQQQGNPRMIKQAQQQVVLKNPNQFNQTKQMPQQKTNNVVPLSQRIVKTQPPKQKEPNMDSQQISLFLSNRTVISKDSTLPNTSLVVVSNLAAGTTEVKLRNMCQGIGEVEVSPFTFV